MLHLFHLRLTFTWTLLYNKNKNKEYSMSIIPFRMVKLIHQWTYILMQVNAYELIIILLDTLHKGIYVEK